MKKVYIVTDLGQGDGGKGGVVHKICNMMSARAVVKVGGCQGSHGVRTSSGESFNFSHWGCGTFDWIKTHISDRMVIHPWGLLNEAEALRYQCGMHNAFSLLTVDERALCATPYHGITSCLKELARGENPRGTVGIGIGQAIRDNERLPDLSMRARDILRADIRDRLAVVREQQIRDIEPVLKEGNFLLGDEARTTEQVALLRSQRFFDYVVDRYRTLARELKIVDPGFLGREILSQDGAVVVESSQGVLSDRFYGFHPYTTALRTLPSFARQMIEDAGYDGNIVSIGATRAYAIRHGAGPMPTDDLLMAKTLLPDSSKDENRYQGRVRVGPLDFVMLKYAIEVCGGPSAFDGLAVSWFDQIQTNGVWRLCSRYSNANDENFFTPSGGIKVRRGTDDRQLEHQEQLGKQLQNCKPENWLIKIPKDATREELFSICAAGFRCELGVPVRMVGFGPTELDKVCQ